MNKSCFLGHARSPTLWQFLGGTTWRHLPPSNDHCRRNFFIGIISFPLSSSIEDSDGVLSSSTASSSLEAVNMRNTGKNCEESGDSVKIPWPTPSETSWLPCQLLCLQHTSSLDISWFPFASGNPGSSIKGSFTFFLISRRLPKLLWKLLLLSVVLLEEFPTSTSMDVVRESMCTSRVFFIPPPPPPPPLSFLHELWASEGTDAINFAVVSSLFGLHFFPNSFN